MENVSKTIASFNMAEMSSKLSLSHIGAASARTIGSLNVAEMSPKFSLNDIGAASAAATVFLIVSIAYSTFLGLSSFSSTGH